MLANHSHLPLHNIEVSFCFVCFCMPSTADMKCVKGWNGKHWEKTSLRKLGLVFQLGHDGGSCPCPSDTTRRLVVGDVTGIHEVQIRFCECLDESEEFTYTWVQVFRQGWFPATTNRPATAFTFRMLNAFQELNFQGKTSLYDYWKSLERITDNSGSGPSLVCTYIVQLTLASNTSSPESLQASITRCTPVAAFDSAQTSRTWARPYRTRRDKGRRPRC